MLALSRIHPLAPSIQELTPFQAEFLTSAPGASSLESTTLTSEIQDAEQILKNAVRQRRLGV